MLKLDFSSYSLEDDSLAPDGGEFYYGETGAQDIPHGFERELKKLDSEIPTKVVISKIIENEKAVEFKSWSKKMTPEGKTALCLDITCFEGDDTWNKSNQSLIKECIDASVKVGLIEESEVFDSLVIRVKDAYPFYDLNYKSKLMKIVTFLEEKNVVHCLGRTGIFRYNNSDGSIEMGTQLAKKLIADESGASALDYKVKEISY